MNSIVKHYVDAKVALEVAKISYKRAHDQAVRDLVDAGLLEYLDIKLPRWEKDEMKETIRRAIERA